MFTHYHAHLSNVTYFSDALSITLQGCRQCNMVAVSCHEEALCGELGCEPSGSYMKKESELIRERGKGERRGLPMSFLHSSSCFWEQAILVSCSMLTLMSDWHKYNGSTVDNFTLAHNCCSTCRRLRRNPSDEQECRSVTTSRAFLALKANNCSRKSNIFFLVSTQRSSEWIILNISFWGDTSSIGCDLQYTPLSKCASDRCGMMIQLLQAI